MGPDVFLELILQIHKSFGMIDDWNAE